MRASWRRAQRAALACAVLALAGCGSSNTSPDAGAVADAGSIDAIPGVTTVLFLQFEGQALTPGSDDATSNRSAIVNGPQTMTPFMSGQEDRDDRIAAVAAAVAEILASYDVAVVTERPDVGPYDMVVLGGVSQDVGLSDGIAGIAPSDCGNSSPSNIVLLFGDSLGALSGPEPHTALVVASFGVVHGIPSSAVVGDCMCWSAPACNPQSTRCTIGGPGTLVEELDVCRAGAATMDYQARFLADFGAAP